MTMTCKWDLVKSRIDKGRKEKELGRRGQVLLRAKEQMKDDGSKR